VFVGLDFSRAVNHTAAVLKRTPDDIRRRLFGQGEPMNSERLTYMNDYECGLMDDAAFHRCVEERLEVPLPFDQFKAAWNDIFLEPIHETIRIAETLHARGQLKLGILSNNNTLHWVAIQPVLPVLKKFEHVFLSHEIGVRKPSARSYQHALSIMNVDATRTIFVDDLPENVLAAQQMGIKTIHAIHARAVRDGFAAHGVAMD
jgi:HAD superfamily hydrolase (TIGR01509 family)